MNGAVFTRIVQLLGDIGPHAHVHVNGHGETTYHQNWMEMCRKVLDTGYRPYIITNLAKGYSDEEVELLAKFACIQISLDSDDDDLMRKVRKAVRVDKVFETIQRIRDAATRHNIHPKPVISFSIGLYDPSIWTLERFVDRLIAFGIRTITFWNLVEMPHQTQVRRLRHLDAQHQIRAREILANVRRKLEIKYVNYVFVGDFDSMIPDLNVARQRRSALRRAYSALTRRTFSIR